MAYFFPNKSRLQKFFSAPRGKKHGTSYKLFFWDDLLLVS